MNVAYVISHIDVENKNLIYNFVVFFSYRFIMAALFMNIKDVMENNIG